MGPHDVMKKAGADLPARHTRYHLSGVETRMCGYAVCTQSFTVTTISLDFL